MPARWNSTCDLCSISIPEFGKPLLSARNLCRSRPFPYSLKVASLSMFTSLESLDLGFRRRPRFGPTSPRPPPPTCPILPALPEFDFRGDIDSLEDFLSRINTPYSLTSPCAPRIGYYSTLYPSMHSHFHRVLRSTVIRHSTGS